MLNPPLSAWEQIGIIVIFVFLLIAFLGGFLGGFLIFARAVLKTIQEISNQFQGFIAARDKQWQEYFEDREQSFKERNTEVSATLRQSFGEVTQVLQGLVNKLDIHADETSKAIAKMDERTQRRTQARKPE